MLDFIAGKNQPMTEEWKQVSVELEVLIKLHIEKIRQSEINRPDK